MTTRLRHGAGRAAPIGVAVLVFGVSFGLLARTAGMGRVAPIVMSATTFAGSAQFAVVSAGSAPKRLVQSQLIVDESWAIAARGGGRFERSVLLGAGLLLYPCWVGGTALGVLGGGFLGDPQRLGLDAAFPALFLALLLPQLDGRRAVAAALAAAALALAPVPVTPAGIPIVAASGACLLG